MAQNEKTMLDIGQQLLTVFAMAAGIIGGYVKFIHGRVHLTRLEPSLTINARQQNGAPYLLVSASVKNIGLTHANLATAGKVLNVRHCEPMRPGEVDKAFPVLWSDEAPVFLFDKEENIEPGECITEDCLIFVPPGEHLAISVQLLITAQKSPWENWFRLKSGEPDYHTWGAQKIIYLEEMDGAGV